MAYICYIRTVPEMLRPLKDNKDQGSYKIRAYVTMHE